MEGEIRHQEEWIDSQEECIKEKSLLKYLSEGSCGERGIRKQINTSHNYLKIRCLLIGKILLFSVYCL